MRYAKLVVMTVALGVTLGATLASADPYPQKREGFFIGCGLGGGSGAVSVSGNGFSTSSEREGGAVGGLRFGWAVHPQFSLGMESNAWARTNNGATVSFSVATLAATYYPNPEQGMYLRAGIGGGQQKLAASQGNFSSSVSQNGFGFTAGAGYEMRLTPHWTLGPALDFGYISVDEQGTSISANYVNFTAAMNWYFF